METLTLPKQVGEFWEMIRPRLREACAEIMTPNERWRFGGGTILAARWGHRRSTDIDLALERRAEGSEIRFWIDPEENTFKRVMGELGATKFTLRPNGISADFRNGNIDILETNIHPAGAERDARVNGRIETVQSNAQILVGKIAGRGLYSPTRDLFDIAVAGKIDPGSVQTAVNGFRGRSINELLGYWTSESEKHKAGADKALIDIPKEHKEFAADPAGSAARSAAGNRYRRINIRWNGKTLEAEAVCKNGAIRRTTMWATDKRGLAAAAEETGITPFLRNNAPRVAFKTLERGETVEWTAREDDGGDGVYRSTQSQ